MSPLPGPFSIQISPGSLFLLIQFSGHVFHQRASLTALFPPPSHSPFDHFRLIVSMAFVAPGHCLFIFPLVSHPSPPLNSTSRRPGVSCARFTVHHQSPVQLLAYCRCSISVALMNIDCSLRAGHWLRCPGFRDEWLFCSQSR